MEQLSFDFVLTQIEEGYKIWEAEVPHIRGSIGRRDFLYHAELGHHPAKKGDTLIIYEGHRKIASNHRIIGVIHTTLGQVRAIDIQEMESHNECDYDGLHLSLLARPTTSSAIPSVNDLTKITLIRYTDI
jgi:hypothetical protein